MQDLVELCQYNLTMVAKAIKELGKHQLSAKKIHRHLTYNKWELFAKEIDTILDMPYKDFKAWFTNNYEEDYITHKTKIFVEDEFNEVFSNCEPRVVHINGLYYAYNGSLVEITEELYNYVLENK